MEPTECTADTTECTARPIQPTECTADTINRIPQPPPSANSFMGKFKPTELTEMYLDEATQRTIERCIAQSPAQRTIIRADIGRGKSIILDWVQLRATKLQIAVFRFDGRRNLNIQKYMDDMAVFCKSVSLHGKMIIIDNVDSMNTGHQLTLSRYILTYTKIPFIMAATTTYNLETSLRSIIDIAEIPPYTAADHFQIASHIVETMSFNISAAHIRHIVALSNNNTRIIIGRLEYAYFAFKRPETISTTDILAICGFDEHAQITEIFQLIAETDFSEAIHCIDRLMDFGISNSDILANFTEFLHHQSTYSVDTTCRYISIIGRYSIHLHTKHDTKLFVFAMIGELIDCSTVGGSGSSGE